MGRLNAFLLVLVIACAMLVINSQHKARGLFVQQDREWQRARDLDVQWNQLQVEQVALSKGARIDSIARAQLKMQPPLESQTRYLALDVQGVTTQAPASGTEEAR